MTELKVPSRIAVNIHNNAINKFDIADHCKKKEESSNKIKFKNIRIKFYNRKKFISIG